MIQTYDLIEMLNHIPNLTAYYICFEFNKINIDILKFMNLCDTWFTTLKYTNLKYQGFQIKYI